MFKDFKYKIKDIIIGNITRRGPFKLLSDRKIILIDYLVTFGRLPDLKNPKKFSERLEWLKLYGGLEKYTQYADKYEVRKLVAKKVGSKYLVPLIGVWEKFEDIDFNKLPKQFVLKANHGSGCVFVCKNKSEIDMGKLKVKVDRWIGQNYYKILQEPQYKSIKPKIVVERYLEDENGGLIDYKIQCFNGEPYLVELHVDRATNHRTAFMDLKWKRLPFRVTFESKDPIRSIKKPEKLKEMLEVARKLAKGLPFLRVDLYYVKNRIYFGELTFTPNNGLLELDPPEYDYKLGKLINLDGFKKN